MKLNTWQILGLVLIVLALAYTLYKRSQPSTTAPDAAPAVQPTLAPSTAPGA